LWIRKEGRGKVIGYNSLEVVKRNMVRVKSKNCQDQVCDDEIFMEELNRRMNLLKEEYQKEEILVNQLMRNENDDMLRSDIPSPNSFVWDL
jgi:hypothetical protein